MHAPSTRVKPGNTADVGRVWGADGIGDGVMKIPEAVSLRLTITWHLSHWAVPWPSPCIGGWQPVLPTKRPLRMASPLLTSVLLGPQGEALSCAGQRHIQTLGSRAFLEQMLTTRRETHFEKWVGCVVRGLQMWLGEFWKETERTIKMNRFLLSRQEGLRWGVPRYQHSKVQDAAI